MKIKNTIKISVFSLFCLSLALNSFAIGENGHNGHHNKHHEIFFELLPENEKTELIQLKKTDPEAFKAAVKEKMKAKRQYLKELKETDPAKHKT